MPPLPAIDVVTVYVIVSDTSSHRTSRFVAVPPTEMMCSIAIRTDVFEARYPAVTSIVDPAVPATNALSADIDQPVPVSMRSDAQTLVVPESTRILH